MRKAIFQHLNLWQLRYKTYCAILVSSSGRALALASRKPTGSKSRSKSWLLQNHISLFAFSARSTVLKKTITSLRLQEKLLKMKKTLMVLLLEVKMERLRPTQRSNPVELESTN
jgi:hypothetical protein